MILEDQWLDARPTFWRISVFYFFLNLTEKFPFL